MRKHGPVKLNRDGLPLDDRAWTVADWRDLYRALQTVIRKVGGRHRAEAEAARRQKTPATRAGKPE